MDYLLDISSSDNSSYFYLNSDKGDLLKILFYYFVLIFNILVRSNLNYSGCEIFI